MSRLIFNAVLGGTTTLESTNSADSFVITVPAANGTMSVKDSSGDATFRNITLTGAVLAGAWNGSTITVPYGGTGATTLTGYVKGNGTSAMTASATIPNTDITGLGTMSTQNANAVTITGGTISGLGTPLAVASGGTGVATLTGLVYGNGTSAMTAASAAQIVSAIGSTAVTNATNATNATTATNIAGGAAGSLPYQTSSGTTTLLAAGSNTQVLTLVAGVPAWANPATSGTVTSVSGTGTVNGLTLTGTVTSSGSLTLGGTLDLSSPPAIGGTSPAAGTFTTLRFNSTLSANGSTGVSGQVLTSNGASAPTWQSISGVGTVTSVDGSGGTTGLTLTGGPITASGTLTLGGTLGVANGGTGLTSVTSNRIPYGNGTSALNTSANLTFDGTTLTSTGLSDSGNLTFTGTGNRITGDFSNATLANRVMFQTSTSSANTRVGMLPTLTSGGTSGPVLYSTSDLANNSFLDIRITDGLQASFQSGITGTGTYLPMTLYTGGSERVRVDTSGNVGVGTSSPSTKLQIAGDATNVLPTSWGQLRITGSTNANQLLMIGYDTTNDYGFIQATKVGTAYQNLILQSGGGNVGIGTSSPGATLDVTHSNGGSVRIRGASGDGARLQLYNNAATTNGFLIGQGYGSASDNVAYISNQATADMIFRTAATERMRIDSSGNVGIGTSSPSYKLHVYGAGSTYGKIQSANAGSGAGLYFQNNTANYLIGAGPVSGGSELAFYDVTNSTERMRIDSSGNVGIGTSSPGARLHVNGGTNTTSGVFVQNQATNVTILSNEATWLGTGTSNNAVVAAFGSNSLLLGTNGAERMRIDSAGKITDQYGNIRAVPQSGSAKTSSYTLATTDVGQFIQISTSGAIVIPNSTFAAGDIVSLFNNTSGGITVTCSTTNAYIAGTDTNKSSVTLATRGVATVLFITSTLCVISGNVS